MVTLQQIIFKLSEFWASRGCLLQQPLDIEMGAGTMHPETFLRVLGPSHWNVAYVQPSRRPADGRFGENPNRLFKHQQFQVILKPAPDEVQQLYLQSLEACGIDLRAHDVRFEEDNWESPTLGAWGIGWQVLFDGQEITQFTYFQQAGGIDLAPISVELTYGIERLAMMLQDVDNVFDRRLDRGREVPRRSPPRRGRAVEICVRPDRHAQARSCTRCTAISSTSTTCFRDAAAIEARAAGARLLPQVLAHVQPARRQRRHRRHGTDGLHPARAAAGGVDCESMGGESDAPGVQRPRRAERSGAELRPGIKHG